MQPDPDTALTESGAGRRLGEWESFSGSGELRRRIDAHKFVVLRGLASAEAAADVLRTLGELVEHEKRDGGVLELDGSKDEEEVLRGQEYMPLHKDGLLMGIDVAYVGIYCRRFRGVVGGRTLLCDAESAVAALPDDLLATLDANGVEARAVDTDYYVEGGEQWYALPAVLHRERGPSLNLGLAYRKGTRPSWRVRIANVSAEDSDAGLASLEHVLMGERFLYRHEWAEGDLLLFDNHRILHGREAYTGERALANLQVRA